jgi:hypothetical protein
VSTLKVPYDRVPKSGDDPLIEVVETVADTIFATCGPSFWGVLVIALLTSVFR